MISLHFDKVTFGICLLLGDLFTVLLILAYRSRYPKDVTSSLFIGGKALQLALLVVLILRGALPSILTLPIMVLLGVGSGMVEALALLQLLEVNNTRIRRSYYLAVGIATGGLYMLYFIFRNKDILIASPALVGALSMVYPAYRLGIKSAGSPLQKMMGFLYSVAIVALGCGAWVYLAPEGSLSAGAAAGLQHFYLGGIYLLMFLGTAGFMLLSREQSYSELERVATYDELTGILNRRAFVLRARPLMLASAKEGVPFSFLLLDVDHFKQVNDTFGHDTGDKVLKDFALKIGAQLRAGDLFGRFGGEEFAVMLHRADERSSDDIAERLRSAVQGAMIDNRQLDYSVSIGVFTVSPSERMPFGSLYKLTDKALYQAKQQGRNRVVRGFGHYPHH